MSGDDVIGEGWGAPCEPMPDDEIWISDIRFSRRTRFPAYVFGSWGVHRALPVSHRGDNLNPDPTSWGVSHCPTGSSIGVALELGFWDAIRIAKALDDTGLFIDDEFGCEDGAFIFEAAVGAALHDHYVWPLPMQTEASTPASSGPRGVRT